MGMDLRYVEMGLVLLVLILLIRMPIEEGTTGSFIRHDRPPVVEFLRPGQGDTVYGGIAVGWRAYDPDGDPLRFTLSYSKHKDQWSQITETDRRSYWWDTSELYGDYFLKVEASDGRKSSQDISDRFYIQRQTEPTIHRISAPSENTVITAGDSVYFSADVSGLQSPKYLWDFDGGAPNKFVEDPGFVKFKVSGTYRVVFSVQSKGKWYEDEVVIRVKEPNQQPVASLVTPVGGEEINGSYTVKWKGTDPEGDALTYTLKYSRNNGLTWSILTRTNSSAYNWDTTSFYNGNYYRLLISASDGKLKGETESQRFTIDNPSTPSNQQPVANVDKPESDKTIVVGDSLYFSGTAVDPDGSISALYWDFDGGARNVFVEDPGNVEFEQEGVFEVSFQARDDKGLWSTSKSVEVTVLEGFLAHINLPSAWEKKIITNGREEDYHMSRMNLREHPLKLEKPGEWAIELDGINVSSDVSVDLSDAMVEAGLARGMRHEKWLELKSTLNLSDGQSFRLTLPSNGARLEKCDDSGRNCLDVTENVTKLSGSAYSSVWEIPIWLGFTTYSATGEEAYVPLNTTINNQAPSVSSVVFEDDDAVPSQEIDLTADDYKLVWCNATVTDNNGYQHVNNVNATLFKSSANPYDSDDNNTHYTNASCELSGGSSTTVDAHCSFRVWYYANPGSWNCSISAWDQGGSYGNSTANTTVNEFLGLTIFNSTLDFGTLNMGDNSTAKIISAKNTCNQQVDIKLWEGNWSGNLTCDSPSTRNISTDTHLAYNLSTVFSVDNSSRLQGSSTTFSEFDLPYTTVEGTNSTKTLYFRLFVPRTGITGSCRGVLSFQVTGDT